MIFLYQTRAVCITFEWKLVVEIYLAVAGRNGLLLVSVHRSRKYHNKEAN